jgi:hypothetical protein
MPASPWTGDGLWCVLEHHRKVRSNEYQPGEDELGPIDFLAIEFPDGPMSASVGILKNAGILTDAELKQQKARILNG